MLSNLIEDWARGVARHVGHFVAKSGLGPNAITIIGFLLNFPVAYVLGQGWFLWGGFLILFAGLFDMLDGAVARATGKSSKFGAFLDSTFDRYSEIVVLLGLLLYFRGVIGETGEKMGGSILTYAAITGSLMVSYVKARSEGLDIPMKGVGLLPRPERVGLTALACLLQPVFGDISLIVLLWVLSVGTNLTALQRILYVWATTGREEKAQMQAAATAKAQPKVPTPPKESDKDKDKETEEVARKRWSFRRVDGR